MKAKYAAARLNDKRIGRAFKRTQQSDARKLPYHLYIWRRHPEAKGYLIRRRGRCIGHFLHYKNMMSEAYRRTVAAGYPKSRWMDLYDWNQT